MAVQERPTDVTDAPHISSATGLVKNSPANDKLGGFCGLLAGQSSHFTQRMLFNNVVTPIVAVWRSRQVVPLPYQLSLSPWASCVLSAGVPSLLLG